jgi:hypothetical protein
MIDTILRSMFQKFARVSRNAPPGRRLNARLTPTESVGCRQMRTESRTTCKAVRSRGFELTLACESATGNLAESDRAIDAAATYVGL